MYAGSQVGAYRLISQLGEGGMGVVWLAEHVQLGRRAAIKMLNARFSQEPEIVQRFFNEARAATAIADPGIVQIFDFGQHEGSAYIVMELLDGEPLDRRLQRLGRLPAMAALRIIRQVASSLEAAHRRGIIHRDLKPENIYLVRDAEVVGGERVKILDFGIAKLGGDANGIRTNASAVMGTPTYMSPEQARGAGRVDHRADIYSLGCVLFALLVGTPPFQSEGAGELLVLHMTEPAPAPSRRTTGITPEVDALVLRCLAKSADQRYQTCAGLASAIAQIVDGSARIALDATAMSGAHPVAGARGSASTTLSQSTGSSIASSASSPRASGRGLFVALGLAVVAIAGGAVWIVSHSSPASSAGSGAAAQLAALPPSPPAATVKPVAPPPATPPEPAKHPIVDLERSHVDAVLAAFPVWAAAHATSPCPTVEDLVPAADWRATVRITCGDQPGDQRIGVVASGADGKFDTADDVRSWDLPRAATEAVRGARWHPAAIAVKKPVSTATKTPAQATKTPPPTTTSSAVHVDSNGIPDVR